jgi:hypothetical protein
MTTVVATSVPVDDLLTVLGQDFAAACRELARARHLRRGKDTPAHRAAVAQACDRIDWVLDVYLGARCDTRGPA